MVGRHFLHHIFTVVNRFSDAQLIPGSYFRLGDMREFTASTLQSHGGPGTILQNDSLQTSGTVPNAISFQRVTWGFVFILLLLLYQHLIRMNQFTRKIVRCAKLLVSPNQCTLQMLAIFFNENMSFAHCNNCQSLTHSLRLS